MAGKPLARLLAEEKFWSLVNRIDGECWDWLGNKTTAGYGTMSLLGKQRYAHRLLYEFLGSGVAKEVEVDHLCRNRGCVRPDHLRLVPAGFNVRQGAAIGGPISWAAKRSISVCRNGHAYSPENTYTDLRGHRSCKACHKVMNREYARRKRARLGGR